MSQQEFQPPAVRVVSVPENEGLLSLFSDKTGSENPPAPSPPAASLGGSQRNAAASGLATIKQRHAPVFTKQFAG